MPAVSGSVFLSMPVVLVMVSLLLRTRAALTLRLTSRRLAPGFVSLEGEVEG